MEGENKNVNKDEGNLEEFQRNPKPVFGFSDGVIKNMPPVSFGHPQVQPHNPVGWPNTKWEGLGPFQNEFPSFRPRGIEYLWQDLGMVQEVAGLRQRGFGVEWQQESQQTKQAILQVQSQNRVMSARIDQTQQQTAAIQQTLSKIKDVIEDSQQILKNIRRKNLSMNFEMSSYQNVNNFQRERKNPKNLDKTPSQQMSQGQYKQLKYKNQFMKAQIQELQSDNIFFRARLRDIQSSIIQQCPSSRKRSIRRKGHEDLQISERELSPVNYTKDQSKRQLKTIQDITFRNWTPDDYQHLKTLIPEEFCQHKLKENIVHYGIDYSPADNSKKQDFHSFIKSIFVGQSIQGLPSIRYCSADSIFPKNNVVKYNLPNGIRLVVPAVGWTIMNVNNPDYCFIFDPE